jgi:hypothetical protein
MNKRNVRVANMLPIEADETSKLLEELKVMKNNLAQLLEERDHLIFFETDRLAAEYMEKIGHLEYAVFQLDVKLKKLKRKIENVRMKIEKGEPIDLAAIDRQIEAEFSHAHKQEKQYRDRMEYIEEEKQAHHLSEENAKTLKEMYYALVKKLHPDLNPDLTEAQLALWHRVQKAYEEKDLEEMTKLFELYDDMLDILPEQTDREEIRKRIERTKQLIHQTLEQITEIRSAFPFTFEQELKDEYWLFEKTAVNRELQRQLTEEYALSQKLLQMMLTDVGIVS